jgi:hypothetical protein
MRIFFTPRFSFVLLQRNRERKREKKGEFNY